MSQLPRRAARLGWLLLAPLLLAALVLRYLVPGRQDIGPGLWGQVARLGENAPMLLGIGLFFLFTLLIRHYRDLLPAGRYLAPLPATAPAAEDTPVWRAISLVSTLVLAGAAALALRATIGQPYRVSSSSMLPTLVPSDHVLVNKLAFGVRLPGSKHRRGGSPPQRGDLVVFRAARVGEASEEEVLVKRVIGLPGDRITMNGGLPVINGWPVPYCDAGKYIHLGLGAPTPGVTDASRGAVVGRLAVEFLGDQAYLSLHTTELREAFRADGYLVGPDEVFVLGDHRNGSRDSRLWRRPGVPLGAIEGRASRSISWDRDGHLDWQRFLLTPGLDVHLPGMDASELRERIATCLKQRPAQTWPPATSVAAVTAP